MAFISFLGFFTPEDISSRPDLIKPVVDLLAQLLDPETGDEDRDFAKAFLKCGYKFVGALAPLAKELECVESISRVFDLIQQRTLWHTFDTQGFNPLPSLRLCLVHNLAEMPAPVVSQFLSDGAGYTYGYRYTKTELKLFLFEHAETFCLVTDLHMNQGLLALYAHAFGAASSLKLSDEDFLPESQFSGKMLSFCERVKFLKDRTCLSQARSTSTCCWWRRPCLLSAKPTRTRKPQRTRLSWSKVRLASWR